MSALKFLNVFNISNTPVLSEYPTPEERQAYVTYKIEQVFKNNFSNHTQVKTEVTDHFIEAIESSPNQLTKAEFLAKYEELYNSFGKGSGIRKMVYDRVKIKQVEEYEIVKNFYLFDIAFVSGIIGAHSVILLDSTSGTGRHLVYLSLIALSILLLFATTQIASLHFSKLKGYNEHRFIRLILKNIKWIIISLFSIAFYFSLNETLIGAKFLALMIFVAAYYNCRRYYINQAQHKRRINQVLTP